MGDQRNGPPVFVYSFLKIPSPANFSEEIPRPPYRFPLCPHWKTEIFSDSIHFCHGSGGPDDFPEEAIFIVGYIECIEGSGAGHASCTHHIGRHMGCAGGAAVGLKRTHIIGRRRSAVRPGSDVNRHWSPSREWRRLCLRWRSRSAWPCRRRA